MFWLEPGSRWINLLNAMPTCVLAKSPQAFAIPASGKFDLRKPTEYLEMLMPLCCGAKELTMVAYGTTCQIQAAAIVEEPGKEWWLVLGLASPQTAHNFKSYLRARVSLDLERMTTLTPWLQRRLGWGGARTTPELLPALQKGARWQPRNRGELFRLRRVVARAELQLRRPRATANPGHPSSPPKTRRFSTSYSKRRRASPRCPGRRHCEHWTTGHSRWATRALSTRGSTRR